MSRWCNGSKLNPANPAFISLHVVKGYEKPCRKVVVEVVYNFVWGYYCLMLWILPHVGKIFQQIKKKLNRWSNLLVSATQGEVDCCTIILRGRTFSWKRRHFTTNPHHAIKSEEVGINRASTHLSKKHLVASKTKMYTFSDAIFWLSISSCLFTWCTACHTLNKSNKMPQTIWHRISGQLF